MQNKNAAVEQLDEELHNKKSLLDETSVAVNENNALIEQTAAKVSAIRDIDRIRTKKTMFGGNVNVSKADFDNLSAMAKKQIAAESKVRELTAEVAKLKKENEQAAKRNATLEQQVQKLYHLKEALRKAENELGILKVKYRRVLEFIEGLKLTQKLQEFLKQMVKGVKR